MTDITTCPGNIEYVSTIISTRSIWPGTRASSRRRCTPISPVYEKAYDGQLGYPRDVHIDYAERVGIDDVGFSITNLSVIRE